MLDYDMTRCGVIDSLCCDTRNSNTCTEDTNVKEKSKSIWNLL